MPVESIILANFPHNLKYLRLSKKPPISQEALAQRLGTTQKCISQYEKGNCLPSVAFVLQLAQYSHIPVDDLLCKDLTKKGL